MGLGTAFMLHPLHCQFSCSCITGKSNFNSYNSSMLHAQRKVVLFALLSCSDAASSTGDSIVRKAHVSYCLSLRALFSQHYDLHLLVG